MLIYIQELNHHLCFRQSFPVYNGVTFTSDMLMSISMSFVPALSFTLFLNCPFLLICYHFPLLPSLYQFHIMITERVDQIFENFILPDFSMSLTKCLCVLYFCVLLKSLIVAK